MTLPPGYLQAVYPIVRQAGGLCCADEVQTGFGRSGSHFWAFETQGAWWEGVCVVCIYLYVRRMDGRMHNNMSFPTPPPYLANQNKQQAWSPTSSPWASPSPTASPWPPS